VERGGIIRRGHKGGAGCCWLIQWTPSASTVRKCFQSDCNTFWIESLLQSDITCLVPSPTLPSLIRRPTVRRLASTRCGPCSLRRHSERLLGAERGLPSLTWESALGIPRERRVHDAALSGHVQAIARGLQTPCLDEGRYVCMCVCIYWLLSIECSSPHCFCGMCEWAALLLLVLRKPERRKGPHRRFTPAQ